MVVHPEQRSINQEVRTALRHNTVYALGSLATRAIGFVPLYTHYPSVNVTVDRRFLADESVIPSVATSYVILGIGQLFQTGLLLAVRTRRIGVVSTLAAIFDGRLSWPGFVANLGIGRLLNVLAVATVLYGLLTAVNLPLGLAIVVKGVASFPLVVIAKILWLDEVAAVESARRAAFSFGARLSGVLPGREGV